MLEHNTSNQGFVGRGCGLSGSLTLLKIMEKCGWCGHNWGCGESKNLDIAPTLAVVNRFLKPYFYHNNNSSSEFYNKEK